MFLAKSDATASLNCGILLEILPGEGIQPPRDRGLIADQGLAPFSKLGGQPFS